MSLSRSKYQLRPYQEECLASIPDAGAFLICMSTARELILRNPELPLVVDVYHDEHEPESYSTDHYEEPEGRIGEMFRHDDFKDKYGEVAIYFDSEELEDAVYENAPYELSDEELVAKVAEYEPYWKKCIIVEV